MAKSPNQKLKLLYLQQLLLQKTRYLRVSTGSPLMS